MHALYDYRPARRPVVRDGNPIEQMLNELESHSLQVCLAPSKRRDRRDWDQIRVVLDAPPSWYRRFCGQHASSRGIRRGKFDTRIKRRNVLQLLRRLAAGQPSRSKYAAELLGIARRVA